MALVAASFAAAAAFAFQEPPARSLVMAPQWGQASASDGMKPGQAGQLASMTPPKSNEVNFAPTKQPTCPSKIEASPHPQGPVGHDNRVALRGLQRQRQQR